ncbi:MAG: ParB/RepB/Spo0J family partition protein, partial [Clostridia bacterium]|nr:ParB/RepB/Spo0J family partition protein [Clostridia bacterium]
AGLTEVPVIVLESDELEAAQIALIENVQRADLNPVEEAQGYKNLIERFGMTQEQLSVQVGKSRSAIANAMRLLDLTDGALELLRAGELSAGHARALLGLRDPGEIDGLAAKIVEQDLSVRAVEAAVRQINARPEQTEPEEPTGEVVIDYYAELERKLMSQLGRRVKIAHTPRKKVLELSYEDNEDLEILLTALCGAGFLDE